MLIKNKYGRIVEIPDGMKHDFEKVDYREEWPFRDYSGFSVLVVRKAGGLGDLVTMIPAVESLSKIASVSLAVPSDFLFLFSHLSVKLIPYKDFSDNSDNYIDVHDFFIDMFCPCGAHEAECFYNPIKGRVENFSEALSQKPFSPQLKGFFKSPLKNLKEKNVLLPIKSNNISKDWPKRHFFKLYFLLADKGIGVYSIDSYRKMPECPYLVKRKVNELPSLALNFDLVVGADSGLMHLSAALGIKTLWLFGPTNGDITTRFYKDSFYIQAEMEKCKSPCYYSFIRGYRCSNKEGFCMDGISPEFVAEKIFSLLHA